MLQLHQFTRTKHLKSIHSLESYKLSPASVTAISISGFYLWLKTAGTVPGSSGGCLCPPLAAARLHYSSKSSANSQRRDAFTESGVFMVCNNIPSCLNITQTTPRTYFTPLSKKTQVSNILSFPSVDFLFYIFSIQVILCAGCRSLVLKSKTGFCYGVEQGQQFK